MFIVIATVIATVIAIAVIATVKAVEANKAHNARVEAGRRARLEDHFNYAKRSHNINAYGAGFGVLGGTKRAGYTYGN